MIQGLYRPTFILFCTSLPHIDHVYTELQVLHHTALQQQLPLIHQDSSGEHK